MVVIVDNRSTGHAYSQVSTAHWVLACGYGLGSVALARLLYKENGTAGFSDNAFGMLIALCYLVAFALIHAATAVGALKRKAWARRTSRVFAFLLFIAFPVGTIWSLYVMPRTRLDRWAAPPLNK
jgi:hypothetical protein